MKTTDPRDPLDQKIDQLLARQPVQASDDFAARVQALVEKQKPAAKPRRLAPIIRFALPLAAAIAVALAIWSQYSQDGTTAPTLVTSKPTETDEEALTSYEIQEILLLQQGLSGFAQIESEELSGGELLDTLETLYSI